MYFYHFTAIAADKTTINKLNTRRKQHRKNAKATNQNNNIQPNVLKKQEKHDSEKTEPELSAPKRNVDTQCKRYNTQTETLFS